MRVLIQRVFNAEVSVSGSIVADIGKGLLLFVGVGKGDTKDDIEYISRKVYNLRIFEDDLKKMNLNIEQVKGEILSVSQFTLYADTKRGNRPGFDHSAKPEAAQILWRRLNDSLRAKGVPVKEGIFGAYMNVKLNNDGPVTIWIDSANH